LALKDVAPKNGKLSPAKGASAGQVVKGKAANGKLKASAAPSPKGNGKSAEPAAKKSTGGKSPSGGKR
jgi:hypothetical protein